jgi:two-component SAPR family response regulator
MSGPELVTKIESLRPNIKSLFVSSYAIVRYGILQSNVNFLLKPFTIENLARKVVEVLNS